MAVKTVKAKNLRSATEASIKAVLGKGFVPRPGVIAGLWIDKGTLGRLDVGAAALAKDLAKQVSIESGIRVTPSIKPGKGGVLVGYIQPKLFR
jgi:hypothetical protein